MNRKTILALSLLSFLFLTTHLQANDSQIPSLKSCSDLLRDADNTKKTHSYYSQIGSKLTGLRKKLTEIFSQRANTIQQSIDRSLTQSHANRDMTFQVKNPKTGFYDRFTAVPVNGIVAPIEEEKFNEMVQSTAPLLRILRKILQNLYANDKISVENLEMQGLPLNVAQHIVRILKNSIYFEPALRHPEMKNYPFLSVSGFDGAFGDPENPLPRFFEMNLGTPSGISNNIQLLADLKNNDPELYENILPYLPKDTTFEILKNTIDQNALSWTGITGGISVVISPGVYNGAHPDVAAIAKYTGMPLVQLSDLYIDQDGYIRLDDGSNNFSKHALVTGIYARTEESYLLQSSQNNIPMINPSFSEVNARLSREKGYKLRDGAVYKYLRSDNGDIIDVEVDWKGHPVMETVWDQLGSDPSQIYSFRPQLIEALHAKKIYISNIGGRVVDDKRLFRLITEYMVPDSQNSALAKPIEGLEPRDFEQFYADPKMYVVKEPGNSGGVGVYFPAFLSENEHAELVARVKAEPEAFEIQHVANVTELPSVINGQKTTVATDMRLFVMLDAKGEVHAGPNSLLLRTAPPGSLYTNTSKGGGYGIGVVYKRVPKRTQITEYELPKPPVKSISNNQHTTFQTAIANLDNLIKNIDLALMSDAIIQLSDLQDEATQLTFTLRGILNHLDDNSIQLFPILRSLIDHDIISKGSLKVIQTNLEKRHIDLIENLKNLNKPTWSSLIKDFIRGLYQSQKRSLLNVELYPQPEITYKSSDESYIKYEIGRYLKVENAEIQDLINEIEEGGGEVRYLRAQHIKDGRLAHEPPYFWVNTGNPTLSSYMKPVIAIDLSETGALPALAHEMVHFRDWLKFYKENRAAGQDHNTAATNAVSSRLELENRVANERAAVDAEIATQLKYVDHPFNFSSSGGRATQFHQRGFTNRMTYPEFEGIRDILYQSKHFNTPINEELLSKYYRYIIQFAHDTKENALKYFKEHSRTADHSHLSNTELIELVMLPYGIERLKENGTLELFCELFRKTEIEMSFQPSRIVSEIDGAEKYAAEQKRNAEEKITQNQSQRQNQQ